METGTFRIITDCSLILLGIWAIFVNSKNKKVLLTPHIRNKVIAEKEEYAKSRSRNIKSTGAISILMAILDWLMIGKFDFMLLLGLIAGLTNFMYFDYKSGKYLQDKE